MLIISEEQFLKEIASSSKKTKEVSDEIIIETTEIPAASNPNDASPNITQPNEVGLVKLENHTYDQFRKKALPNIPESMRPIIGALASQDSIDNIASAFGISKDTVGDLANDKHSNGEVSEKKINILEKVRDNTLAKLDTCIDFLAISRDMKPKEHVAIAESLARIHEKLAPKVDPDKNITQFIFYSPERQNKIEDYEVIEANT